MRATIRTPTHLHAIVLAAATLAAIPVHAISEPPVPIVIAHALDALEHRDLPTAKRILAPLVACSNPEALMLWGSLHDAGAEHPINNNAPSSTTPKPPSQGTHVLTLPSRATRPIGTPPTATLALTPTSSPTDGPRESPRN